MEITAEEGRVLGCLVEKQLTTPQLYPLTENALLAACNQTTARDPVVDFDVATVRLAVRGLRDKDLVRTVHRVGERSDKHLHLLGEALDLSPEQVALLAVLLLRGPQTLGELRARTERMHPFGSLEEVARVLDALADRDEPLVTALERQAGRKETRYTDLLVGGAPSPPVSSPPVSSLPVSSPPVSSPSARAPQSGGDGGTPAGDHLAAEVAALRAEVAALRARVDALEA